eukprot:3892241-Rhodomonas_salina.5
MLPAPAYSLSSALLSPGSSIPLAQYKLRVGNEYQASMRTRVDTWYLSGTRPAMHVRVGS